MKCLLNRDDNAWLSRLQDGGRCLLKYIEIKTEADSVAQVHVIRSSFIIFLQISGERIQEEDCPLEQSFQLYQFMQNISK